MAVIGGGPSGSIFGYFLLDIAERAGIRVYVDIYENKDFSRCGPGGCNRCGGIVSESLVQLLAAEGVNLPSRIVQRGIESYVMHMEGGSVRIATPFQEKRIASLHRGAGPMGGAPDKDGSFDGFLQSLVKDKGAAIIPEKATDLKFQDGRPVVTTKTGRSETYDLLAGAVGINSASLTLFEDLDLGFQTPTAAKTYICEMHLGNEDVKRYFGNAMHPK